MRKTNLPIAIEKAFVHAMESNDPIVKGKLLALLYIIAPKKNQLIDIKQALVLKH